MIDSADRQFRLSLTIAEDDGFEGTHAVIALVADEKTPGIPVLRIQAGGVPRSDEGAGELADMLRDAADAIDDHLSKTREHTRTDTLPILTPKSAVTDAQRAHKATIEAVGDFPKCSMVGCTLEHTRPRMGESIMRHYDQEHLASNEVRKRPERPRFNPRPRGTE